LLILLSTIKIDVFDVLFILFFASSALGVSVTSEETADSVISIPVNMDTELCWDLEEKDIKEL